MKLKKHRLVPAAQTGQVEQVSKATHTGQVEQVNKATHTGQVEQVNKATHTGQVEQDGETAHTGQIEQVNKAALNGRVRRVNKATHTGRVRRVNKATLNGRVKRVNKAEYPDMSNSGDKFTKVLAIFLSFAVGLIVYLRDMSKKKKILSLSGVAAFVVFLIMTGVIHSLISQETSQQMAERWGGGDDTAHVSCFIARDAQVSQDTLENFRHSIDDALLANSITVESTNPSARLWTDAYSAAGKLTVQSDRGSIDAKAIGIGGDFFLFHPEQLLYGAYFSGNDVLQDYCILDEDGAWQLFGSSDVAGQLVSINGVPHVVSGVIRRPEGKLYKEAGLDTTIVYVSYETLHNLGTDYGINHYEIVMPNPVTSFAANFLKDNIGVSEENCNIVENSTRYDFVKRLQLVTKFGSRSMNGKGIIYPYWENVARGYEDITSLLTFLSMLFLVYSLVLVLIAVILGWKHKHWTLGSIYHKIKDKWERHRENAWAKKQRKKALLNRS
jgi:hypothetical protein